MVFQLAILPTDLLEAYTQQFPKGVSDAFEELHDTPIDHFFLSKILTHNQQICIQDSYLENHTCTHSME